MNAVLTCSALKRSYRDILRSSISTSSTPSGDSNNSDNNNNNNDKKKSPILFVHLKGSKELIASRLSARTGHFMNPKLLDSQVFNNNKKEII